MWTKLSLSLDRARPSLCKMSCTHISAMARHLGRTPLSTIRSFRRMSIDGRVRAVPHQNDYNHVNLYSTTALVEKRSFWDAQLILVSNGRNSAAEPRPIELPPEVAAEFIPRTIVDEMAAEAREDEIAKEKVPRTDTSLPSPLCLPCHSLCLGAGATKVQNHQLNALEAQVLGTDSPQRNIRQSQADLRRHSTQVL